MRNTIVVFDIGGVLLRLEFRKMFEEFAKHSKRSVEDIKKGFATTAIDKRLMRGEGEKEYYDNIRDILGNKTISDNEIRRALELSIPGTIDEMIALKRRLHESGCAVGIISNAADWSHKHVDENYPEMTETWGGPRIFSYQIKRIKPEPEIYDAFEKMLPKGTRVIFIEDKSSYLQYPVEKLHWIGIHLTPFRDPDETIRHVEGGHQDAERIYGEWYEATSPQEAEEVLARLGLIFNKS